MLGKLSSETSIHKMVKKSRPSLDSPQGPWVPDVNMPDISQNTRCCRDEQDSHGLAGSPASKLVLPSLNVA